MNGVCKDPRLRRGLLAPLVPKEGACFLQLLPRYHPSITPSFRHGGGVGVRPCRLDSCSGQRLLYSCYIVPFLGPPLAIPIHN